MRRDACCRFVLLDADLPHAVHFFQGSGLSAKKLEGELAAHNVERGVGHRHRLGSARFTDLVTRDLSKPPPSVSRHLTAARLRLRPTLRVATLPCRLVLENADTLHRHERPAGEHLVQNRQQLLDVRLVIHDLDQDR